MASNRRWRCHQTPPPPPYEANQFCLQDTSQNSLRSHSSTQHNTHLNHQTIPKTTHPIGSRTRMSPGDRYVPEKWTASGSEQQVRKYNQETSGHVNPNRKHSPSSHRSGGRNDNNDNFIRSLAAPRSFFEHISVEPLALLVIVALYIEFPAIQDLIWTKICLEVIAAHPGFGQTASSASPSIANGSSDVSNPFVTNSSTSGLGAVLNSSPSSSGRILDISANHSISEVTLNQQLNFGMISSQSHILCDRFNKQKVPSEIRQQIIDVDSLFWLKYQILICSLCLLASPYWGGLSDKIGRLIPMNVPGIAGVLCNMISLAFGLLISLDSHSIFHIEWLYVGAVIVGFSGGQTVLIMNLFSFISDNTTSEGRSRRVTILESVIFVAHSLGFFISKMIMLLGLDPPDRPWLNRHFVAFSACILLNSLGVLYSVARLRHQKFHRFLNNFEREQREVTIAGSSSTQQLGAGSSSLSISGRQVPDLMNCAGGSAERLRELTLSTPDDPDGPLARSDKADWSFWDAMITFRYYRETYEITFKERDSRAIILMLIISGFISALSLTALMSLFFIYVKMDPFNWSTSQYSQWNSISSIMRGIALVGLTLMMRFYPGWSAPDPLVAAVGFLAKGAGLLTIGLAQSVSHLNWSLIALTFSEYSMPPIRSLLSKLVVREELCKIYSCLGASQSFCFILGNIAFYLAFTTFTEQRIFRLCFSIVAGIEFATVILMLVIYKSVRRQMPQILS